MRSFLEMVTRPVVLTFKGIVMLWIALFAWLAIDVYVFAQGTSKKPTPSAIVVPTRFKVTSQQYLDSGAKLVIIQDGSTQKCYGIYEAGGAGVLGELQCH